MEEWEKMDEADLIGNDSHASATLSCILGILDNSLEDEYYSNISNRTIYAIFTKYLFTFPDIST